MKNQYLLTLKADDRPGLLHLVTGVLNKKLIPIISLTAAPTDIHQVVLITMQIEISDRALEPLLQKLENIIEVYSAEAVPCEDTICQRAAYFLLDREFMNSSNIGIIRKWELQLVNLHEQTVLFAKCGSDALIRRVYNELEGALLLGFSQTGVIADTGLIQHNDTERISRLAA